MNCLDLANEYFNAWNTHDADAIVNTFAVDGMYYDPTTREIAGDDIGANAKRLWRARDEETEEIRKLSRHTAMAMLSMDGFIGVTLVRIGGRSVTISAWEKPEHTKQLMSGGPHGKAMRRFWADLGQSAFTSVWIPDHINPLWIRCNVCNQMKDYEKNSGVCTCGQPLPEAPAYF